LQAMWEEVVATNLSCHLPGEKTGKTHCLYRDGSCFGWHSLRGLQNAKQEL